MVDHLVAAVAAARIFERTGIAYALDGSVASSFLGEPRTTMDVDLAVMMPSETIDAFVTASQAEFHVQREAVGEAVRDRRLFIMIHRGFYVKVDVHVVPDRAIFRAEIERARWTRLSRTSEEEIRVATPGDLVLQKLPWFRSSGEVSERQWRDVQGFLKVRRGGLDLGYMRRWAREENILPLLERAFRECGYPERRGDPGGEEDET